MVRFIRPTTEMVEKVAEGMREADRLEVWLSHRKTPLEALSESVEVSPLLCSAIVDESGPFAIMGVGAPSVLATSGAPWLLGTDRIDHERRVIWAWSRGVIRAMHQQYSTLENWVHTGNLTSIRWLRSCGFELSPASPWGPFGAPFHKFRSRR